MKLFVRSVNPYFCGSFLAWMLAYIEQINAVLQALALTVSLAVGLIGLFKQFKRKKS